MKKHTRREIIEIVTAELRQSVKREYHTYGTIKGINFELKIDEIIDRLTTDYPEKYELIDNYNYLRLRNAILKEYDVSTKKTILER
jgi:uncharacterized protein with HEPN domain